MLALDIRSTGTPTEIRAATEKWWKITDAELARYADTVLAVVDNVIVGVFEVRGYHRDAAADGRVVFDLGPEPEWEWVIGRPSPSIWANHHRDPVKRLGEATVEALRKRHPDYRQSAHGWVFDVAPDGKSATVRGPGAHLVVAGLADGVARLAVRDAEH
ncbi:hypothetical protein [Amycolatopsis sp. SID8362]|uniref:hypothetical protein n=1 Tax=Amycolatopsis sp. SID8362 TaxID=2690346 RepID=UPI00136F3AC1|nr:hypothetical protein [Amycolatopsis sp. SID8362]NBH11341.1 hypothetical protein [Amycolatopsis sp. SID8362]NED48033.1 hypothetical protein [Amycolatopsis sp. SID8362]